MTYLNRRHLGSLILAAGATTALAGCAATAASVQGVITTAESDIKKFVTTVTTDLTSLTTQWGTIKGIGEVAIAALTVTNPVGAAAIGTAIGLGDTAIAFLTSASTASAAATVQTNVQTVLDSISSIVTNAQGAFDAVKTVV